MDPPSYEMTTQHPNTYPDGSQYQPAYPSAYNAGYQPEYPTEYQQPEYQPQYSPEYQPEYQYDYHPEFQSGYTDYQAEYQAEYPTEFSSKTETAHRSSVPSERGPPQRPPIPPRPPQDVVNAHFNTPGPTHTDADVTEQTPYHQVAAIPTRRGSSDQATTPQNQSTANEEEEKNQFTEKSVRLNFVKKVFAVLLCQLAFTAAMMCLLLFVQPIRQYLRYHDWLYITSLVLTIVLMAVFAFVPKLRRTWPWNLVFLLIITFLMSLTLGAVASTMDTDEVLMAVGIVCVVVVVCIILGFQRKFDFTPLVGFVAMLATCVAAFAFLNIFFHSRALRVAFAALGAFMYSMWLLLDIQLMLKGKHKLSPSPDEYISGALNLYIDIVYILFMMFAIFRRT